MANILLLVISGIYFFVLFALTLYGLNHYYLAYLALKYKHKTVDKPDPNLNTWPKVTVQLPIYNEKYVARRLILSAVEMDYPKGLIEFQVLDDSTDETAGIVEDLVDELNHQGVNIHHVRRGNREGFKAGALQEGLLRSSGEYLVIFDADFLPTNDFLKEAIPYFEDKSVGFVQGRWGHLNQGYSLLTAIQSLALDAHFMIEQFSRYLGGYIFNFNGTAGVWRKSAILDAGGWQPHTLTEDLDLSYRAFLKGWRGVYIRDLAVNAEIPVTLSAYRRQQHRWARGSLENAAILLPKVWRSDLRLMSKIEASLHLTGYFVHILLFLLCMLFPLVTFISSRLDVSPGLSQLAVIFNVTALAPTTLFIVAQSQLGKQWLRNILLILFTSAFGSGMMLNTLRAGWGAVIGNAPVFERTPKLGIVDKSQSWVNTTYHLGFDRIALFEIIFGLFNLYSMVTSWQAGYYFITFYSGLFSLGLLYVSITSIVQTFDQKESDKYK